MSYLTIKIISLIVSVIIMLFALAYRNKDNTSNPSYTNNGNESKKVNKIKKSIVIGRHPNSDVVVHDPCVNKYCIRITQYEDGHLTLLDLQSANGCLVNGKRVLGEIELHYCDVVKIGNTVLPWLTYF